MAANFSSMDDPRIAAAVAGERAYPDNKSAAARSVGISISTYKSALRYIERNRAAPKKEVDLPIFPDEDLPANEILDSMAKRYEQRKAHHDATNWFKIKIKSDDPIGFAVVGDPHLGNNGCNIPLLRRDVEIMATTPGIHAMNIGDTADNWGGRLIHAYSENDVSRQTERRLARWFLQDAGIPWLVWLMGNHDMMDGEFSTYLKAINGSTIPMLDWRAKFILTFPSGREVRVDASHNHKGTSIYNPLHGQKRAALWNEDADIYVAGHHHMCAVAQEEAQDGRWVTMARARGYKWIDHWAETHGFPTNEYGSTIVFVIDPSATSPVGLIQPFADLKVGAEFLTHLRRSG